MDEDVYETYAPVLVGLSSVVLSKNSSIELDRLKLSESQVVSKESSRIQTQDPWRVPMRTGRATTSETGTKTIQLTADQQRVLNGPNRQFILGAAGTGKTVMLQERVLRLLQNDSSVLVLALELNRRKYKELFEESSSSKFDVRSWPGTAQKIWLSCEMQLPNRLEWMNRTELSHLIDGALSRAKFDDLWRYDHILIDDALDWTPIFGNAHELTFVCLLIFAMAVRDHPEKTLWIALDPICYDYGPNQLFDRGAAWMIRNFSESSLILLNSVLRCPESVYQAAYHSVHFRWPGIAWPHCGQKIGGVHVSIARKARTSEKAVEWILDSITRELTGLLKDGVNRQDIAIIASPFGDLVDQLRDRVASIGWKEDDLERPSKRPKFDDEQSIIIREWHEVSSFDWPVVIYASVTGGGPKYRSVAAYQKYRAASRTTGKLIETVSILDEDEKYVTGTAKEI